MTGLNKFSDKERRLQRRRNHIAKDLGTPKYRQRTIPDKRRVDDENGNYYLVDRYYDEDDEDWR